MTTLVRWDPAVEVDYLQTEMNRLFDGFFGGGRAANGGRRWLPAMDLVEEGNDLVLRADLPGMSKEDVSIEVKDGVLTISGERRREYDAKEGSHFRVERSYGRFSRSMTLPEGIESDRISADFDRGVLEVRVPKPAQRTPHRVEIGARRDEALQGEASEN
jgi:HSP20 family protein